MDFFAILSKEFFEKGALGLLALVSLMVAWYKDRQVQRLTQQLIEGYRGLAQDMAKLIDTNYVETVNHDKEERLARGGERDHPQLERGTGQDQPTTPGTNKKKAKRF